MMRFVPRGNYAAVTAASREISVGDRVQYYNTLGVVVGEDAETVEVLWADGTQAPIYRYELQYNGSPAPVGA